jgi:hypothetical protein
MMVTNKGSSQSTSKLPIIIIAIVGAIFLCCCVIVFVAGFLYLQKDDVQPNDFSGQDAPLSVPSSTQILPESDPQNQIWLVMFYLDADDAVLEEDIYFDLNEIESIGSTDRVQMVAQIDRNDEVFTADGDWTSARRYHMMQDSDLNTLQSEMVADLGEVDMGSRDTLLDFTTWAIQTYPADKYVLIMSDHGSGWPGGWSDNTPLNENENWLYLNDVEYVLNQTIANTGIGQFELIGMDACLMSMLEVYNTLAPYAHYAVASQETEPSFGWAYASFLGDLTAQPEMSGADLGRAIVNSYIDEDLRIRDDEARQKLLNNYGLPDEYTADDLANEMGTTITIAAVDLSSLPQMNDALNTFLQLLKNVDQAKVAESRAYAQAFYNVFDDSYPSPYIDLSNFGNFVVETTNDETVNLAFQDLQTGITNTVIAEKHGNQRPGASGISVFFPVSELYWNEEFGYDYYSEASSSSASQTLWDDFLAYHYAGQEFGSGNPSKDARLPAPGAAQVTIDPILITPTTVSDNEEINIQTDIAGKNIANIYLVVMYKNEDDYIAYFTDYIKGDQSQELDGVTYPVWARQNDKIHISLDWVPSPDGVCNGSTCAFALLNPDKYTPNTENLLYFVEGWYIRSDTGEKTEATMYFNNYGDNLLNKIVTFTPGNNTISLAREISPTPGDEFMMLDTWWSVDADGQIEDTYHEGNVLTFGNEPLYTVTVGKADPGEYAIGIMVEDMDGFLTYQFSPITIQ